MKTIRIVIALMIMTASSYAAATAQSITATTTGTSANLTLTANITVANPADTGKVGNLYVVALWSGKAYVLGPNSWTEYDGLAIPAVRSGVALGTHTVPVISSPLDVTSLLGMGVYAGYGVGSDGVLAQNDFLSNGKFALIHTVTITPSCSTGQTWTAGVNACVSTKGTVFYQLPAGCNNATQQCFKDAGQFMTTVADGANSTIAWRLFKNTTYSGLWNFLPVHTADGTPIAADISGGFDIELDAVWTAPPTTAGVPQEGVVVRQKDTVFCHRWTASGNAFEIVCPSN